MVEKRKGPERYQGRQTFAVQAYIPALHCPRYVDVMRLLSVTPFCYWLELNVRTPKTARHFPTVTVLPLFSVVPWSDSE